jgi:predicted ferric reductase
MLDGKLWWYVARSSGIMAWFLAVAAVLWGLALSTRAMGKRPAAPWLLDLHRFLSGLAVAFTGIHLAGLFFDNYTHWAWKELFVPLASKWKPGPTAWGIVAIYLLIAVEATSLVMNRIPRRVWRAIHFTSFALFVTATIHLLQAGTDRENYVLRWAVLLAVVAVLFFTIYRILMAIFGRTPPAADRAAMLAAARRRQVV